MASDNSEYWAMRNVEFQLQSAIKERDAYKAQAEWLQKQLSATLAQLELSYARYHDISIAHTDVLDRALDMHPSSTVKNITIDGRSILLLQDPVVPSRKLNRA